jgi:glycosyltransferase involved in cell wall biosynthesis
MQKPTRSELRFACVGSHTPRQCGIATFTHDLCEAICAELKNPDACQVIAVNDSPDGYRYPDRVRFEIRQEEAGDYRLAADFVNIRGVDLLLVQHEFGIMGGEAGSHLLGMLRDVSVPVVTTMHTVLRNPADHYRRAIRQLVELSDRVVVMSDRAVEILQDVYGVARERVAAIPHGIPDVPFVDPGFYKDQFGVEGRRVLLTFGLLSPGKGVENVILALPEIVRAHSDVMYIILGATHPHVRKTRGEEYRHELQRLSEELGMLDHVMFQNRYVDLEELCEFLGAADLYITPYLGEEQIVSGTLAYALGAGKAVVSTPYWYAQEVLAEDRGRLVPFGDPEAIAREVNWLLDHDVECQAMRKRAYLFTREFVWREVARSYLRVFDSVRKHPLVDRQRTSARGSRSASFTYAVPEVKLDHLRNLTDDVGILQHARYCIPERNYGYCTDDNARALVFAVQAYRHMGDPVLPSLASTYLSFLWHAYNPESGRFRNFMSYDRRWLEDAGSEDSHGRALWGLGCAVADAPLVGMRAAAVDLFNQALRATEAFTSPRAWAFTIVGVHAYLRRYGGDSDARRVREKLAEQLFLLFRENSAADWVWPEDKVTYANGKLPHALLLAGQWMQRADMVNLGLCSLEWLLRVKSTPDGVLSPIGNDGWYERDGQRAQFDQQPLEVHALLEACLEAYNITADKQWLKQARRCFDWFLGKNPVKRVLYDYETGGCRDGLQPSGVNENQGAESTLAWLLSLLAIRATETDVRDFWAGRPAALDRAERAGTRDVDGYIAEPQR